MATSASSLSRRSSVPSKPKFKSKCFRYIDKWSFGEADTGNAIIHGDNLPVLEHLSSDYHDSVKCAYIDPPYNNGESYTHYSDSMSHDEWIRNVTVRLELIRRLLRKDGALWISIDDGGLHYLKVAADQVFGRDNFLTTIVWEHRTTRENRRAFSNNHEYLLVYAKNAASFRKSRNTLPLTEAVKARYKNPDGDARGPWQSVSASVQDGHATPDQFYTLTAPNGRQHNPPKGRCWIYTKTKMQREIKRNNVWFGNNGNGVPRLKFFLSERKAGLAPETLWPSDAVGTTTAAKKHLLQIFPGASLFDTPKPESLIQRVLHISTNAGDLVLDAYLGSGTTAAVSHKMGRRYIGIENGNHSMTHCAMRLKQVIAGEPGGVSESVGWQGGGGFNFYRLMRT